MTLSKSIYLQIVPLGVALTAEPAAVPLALVHVGVDVLSRVFLEVPLLREPLAAPLALEGFDALVHAHVVQQVPGLLQDLVTARVLALVLDCVFLFAVVIVLDARILAFNQLSYKFVFLMI